MDGQKNWRKRSPDALALDKEVMRYIAKAKEPITFTHLLEILEPDAYAAINKKRSMLFRSLKVLEKDNKITRTDDDTKVLYSAK